MNLFYEYRELGETKLSMNTLFGVARVLAERPDINDAFSQGQLASKAWLIKELSNVVNEKSGYWSGKDLNVLVCAGWVGALSAFLLDQNSIPINRVRSFDQNPDWEEIADNLNRINLMHEWRFKAFSADAYDLSYNPVLYRTREKNFEFFPDIIINTSVEHFERPNELWKGFPSQKLLVLQASNDPNQEGHYNVYPSLDLFKKAFPLEEIYFSGELDCGGYKRFMLIGLKGS